MIELIIAVLIFVFSQFSLKIVIEPYVNFKKCRKEVSFQLLANQGKIYSQKSMPEVSKKFYELASKLRASFNSILGYWSFRFFLNLPTGKDVKLVSQDLKRIAYQPSQEGKNDIEVFDTLQLFVKRLKIDTRFTTRDQF